MSIEPARLAFRDDGTPFSEEFGDIYHTSAGGLTQAHTVFLAGNHLPSRWQGRRSFTILETGFGIGLNFLATWAAWQRDPHRCTRLNFVSTELHPFSAEDLARLHAQWPELADLSSQLRAHWPVLTPGFHRLHLDAGQVSLTLLLGDANQTLTQLNCQADAVYLDGFSPTKNPEMWSEQVIQTLPRLTAPGATVATWSVNSTVRSRLIDAGFDCDKTRGFGPKREMLVGRSRKVSNDSAPLPQQHALVIGAGLAGSSIANRLAERQWRVELIDAANGPGQGASGNHAGVIRPLPSLDDNLLARLTRAGSEYGRHHLARLSLAGHPVKWDGCGVLHLARDPTQEAKQRAVVERHRYPAEFLRFVERDEASDLAGWPVSQGGWWFGRGGWIQPPSLCDSNLSSAGPHLKLHFGRTLGQLVRDGTDWVAYDSQFKEIARAPVAIIANGIGINALTQTAALPVRSARGQVSHLQADTASAPKVVVCRLGYVSPALDGLRCVGATFSMDDADPELRLEDHRENLAKLDFMLPGLNPAPTGSAESLQGRVGFRPASPDRLPIVGAVPAITSAELTHNSGNRSGLAPSLANIPRYPALYAISGFGARGLVWCSLVAETLASQLNGDPLPLEQELVDAIDPARYISRPVRPRKLSHD